MVEETVGQGASASEGKAANSFFQKALTWRCIGPYRGGRVVAVAGDYAHPQTFYFGSTGGGVWKTTDGGLYWQNVSDGFFKRASVGALAVAPSDPNIIYAGMGEATIRGNVSHGDGVYKSTDGGTTWTHLGLEQTRNIAKIRVHPQNPDIVYVAAFGHAHGPNAERGIYRSTDGGASWQQVLSRGEDIGANELAMDPHNPRILYAAMWRARRLPHTLISGGEGCGIFRSTDGGDTWSELTRNKGLPQGTVGKIGLALSPARTGRVWAMVEAEDGGLYRSDDGGTTWERTCDDRAIRQRPWYYQHLIADPQDAETLWVLSVRLWRSTDGGRIFTRMSAPHGDNHDLWIDPRDPRRMILGHDGGACVTFNGGESWSSIYNQPTAEFYHVTTDTETPYNVYGAQQDNSTMRVASRSSLGAITQANCAEIGGGESGYIAVRPDQPNIVFAGNYQGYISRYDRATSQRRDITVWPEPRIGSPAKDVRYRFQWTFPILLSPHDPNVLYVAGNRVFRSTDEGASWEPISPDLTRHDESRLGDSGGPITCDNCGTEYYATVFAFAESPRQRGLFWAGSDDGLVHLSRDGGATWENVTPEGLPEWALISIIEPSPHEPAVAYLAATRYKLDDFHPYLYKTDDYGKHWTPITTGLPENVFTRVIREDPERRGLLYAGTEAGVYVSFDDGGHWESLQQNLPVVPIHDLIVKNGDLVAATHGRSFWILDDVAPLRQMTDEIRSASMHLFAPRPTVRFATDRDWGSTPLAGVNYGYAGAWLTSFREVTKPNGEKARIALDTGENPHDGVYVTYALREKPEGEVTLTFLDGEGKTIIAFSSEERKRRISYAGDARVSTDERKWEQPEPQVEKDAGMHRFYWDMRYPPAKPVAGFVARSGDVSGPQVPPGRYSVRLTVGDQSATESFEVRIDPRVNVAQADLEAQFELLMQIRDKVSETHDAIHQLRSVRQQVEEWVQRSAELPEHEEIAKMGGAIGERLGAIEGELIQVRALEDDDTLRLPLGLNTQFAELFGVVGSADAAPTRQSREVFAELSARLDTQQRRLREALDGEVAALATRVREANVPLIAPSAAMPAPPTTLSFGG